MTTDLAGDFPPPFFKADLNNSDAILRNVTPTMQEGVTFKAVEAMSVQI
jgi:hypothetical protein